MQGIGLDEQSVLYEYGICGQAGVLLFMKGQLDGLHVTFIHLANENKIYNWKAFTPCID